MQKCIVVFLMNVDKWGAERSVCSLCHYLQQMGQKVVVVIPRKGLVTELLNEYSIEYIIHNYSVSHYHAGHFPRWDRYCCKLIRKPFDVWMITRELHKKGYIPQLIYSASLPVDAGLICARILHVPHVQHIRENMDAFGYKFLLGKKLSLEINNKISSLFICTCQSIKDIYAEYIDVSKVVVIHNGVPSVIQLREKSFDDKVRILQVGRYMPDKRIIDTLSAANILVSKGIDQFKIDIFGYGFEENKYKSFIEENNLSSYVEIKGFSDNIDYTLYHIGLMTSKFEAFSRSVLDYMNNGLAVVASDTGGNIEQVVDGKTGFLYKSTSTDDLAAKLEKLIQNPQLILQMGIKGRERFLENFTQVKYQEKAANAILSLIQHE